MPSDSSTTEPLRLLHVVESLGRGGLERVVCDLVLHQAGQGHEVEVLCLFEAGGFAAELTNARIPVIVANKRPGLDLSVLRILRATSRKARHQVVHTHNPVANYYTCIAEATTWRSLPIVNTRHNMGASDPRDRREKLFRLSVTRTAKVAMVSPQVSRRFIEAGIVPAKKAAVVMNGIPLDRYIQSNDANRARARAALSIADGAVVIGCVGRLVRVKNHELLLAAVSPICRRRPEVRVVLLGEGELREALLRQAARLGIADSVQLLGEREDIPHVLPAFDVFVMPSRSEGHSIALLESAACGISAVATAVGGNSEIVHDGVTGLLVPSEDEGALRAALERLIDSPLERLALGARAREWAEGTVSVRAMAANYEQIYREVLGAPPRELGPNLVAKSVQ